MGLFKMLGTQDIILMLVQDNLSIFWRTMNFHSTRKDILQQQKPYVLYFNTIWQWNGDEFLS